MKYYTGIGSRRTPAHILPYCTYMAGLLERLGFTLRSGGAEGADQAFERGVKCPLKKEILRPKRSSEAALKVAEKVHPAWHMCNDYARALHGRNVQLILGRNLDSHSSFVLAYSENPNIGGTRTGIVVAKENRIPVYNLAVPEELHFFLKKACQGISKWVDLIDP